MSSDVFCAHFSPCLPKLRNHQFWWVTKKDTPICKLLKVDLVFVGIEKKAPKGNQPFEGIPPKFERLSERAVTIFFAPAKKRKVETMDVSWCLPSGESKLCNLGFLTVRETKRLSRPPESIGKRGWLLVFGFSD